MPEVINESGNEKTAFLQCRDLRKSFTLRGRTVPVLNGVNLAVHRGEKVVITGKSGTGKSTLLGLLAGLEPPNGGRVIFDGQPLSEMKNEELAELRRQEIGIVFQNFNLLPSWTAFENVEAALLHSGLTKAARREKAIHCLAGLGLAELLDHLPTEMSIGQQQRVAVARALIREPKLLLADEPTGDVDPETGSEIRELLFSAVREKGATLVVVTHGAFPLSSADRVFYLKDGVLAS